MSIEILKRKMKETFREAARKRKEKGIQKEKWHFEIRKLLIIMNNKSETIWRFFKFRLDNIF